MGWKLLSVFLNEIDERELLEEYGLCCDTPAIQVIYSLKTGKEKPKEGFFICYECLICSDKLYVTNAICDKPGVWINGANKK